MKIGLEPGQTWTKAAVIAAFAMIPHEEGGYYREIWASENASQIYYLLAAGEVGAWHRIQSEEIWFWHYGAEAEIRLGGTGKAPLFDQAELLGSGNFSLRIPGNTWQQAVNLGDDFVLFSCVTVPPYRCDELELYIAEF